MKIAIFSTFYGIPDFTKISMLNHYHYSLKHKYDYLPDFLVKPTERQFSWAKIFLAIQLLESNCYDAIFWMDADSLFLNSDITIESFLNYAPEPIQFTGDYNDIFNGGHIILRNDPKAIEWLKDCWKVCYTNTSNFNTTHKNDTHLFDQPGILSVLGGCDPDDQSTWLTGFNAVNGFQENPSRKILNFQQSYAPITMELCKNSESLICNKWKKYCKIWPQHSMNSYPWDFSNNDFIVHFVGNTKHLMFEWYDQFRVFS